MLPATSGRVQTAYSAWDGPSHNPGWAFPPPGQEHQLGCSGLQGTKEGDKKGVYHFQSKQLEAGAAPSLKPGLHNAPEDQVLSIFLFSLLRLHCAQPFSLMIMKWLPLFHWVHLRTITPKCRRKTFSMHVSFYLGRGPFPQPPCGLPFKSLKPRILYVLKP